MSAGKRPRRRRRCTRAGVASAASARGCALVTDRRSPDHDALDTREVALDAHRVETRRRASARPPRAPARRRPPAPRGARARARPAGRAARGSWRGRRRPRTAPRGLVAEDLRRQRRPLGVGHVGGVAEQRVELVGHPLQQVGVHPRDLQPQLARRWRGRARAPCSLTSLPVTRRSGRSSLSASATAPLPVPTSSTLRPAAAEADLHQQLGLRARDQRARVHVQLQAAEAAHAGDVGDRLARHRAAAHRLLVGPHSGARHSQLAVGRAGARGRRPSMWASSTSASRRGVSTPAAVNAVIAPSSASRRGHRSAVGRRVRRPESSGAAHHAHCGLTPPSAPPACGASRRTAVPAVNSSSSPSSTASRLWVVSLMRWSVTRRSP